MDKPVSGYLGGVAISPVTTILDQPEPLISIRGAALIPGMASIFPDFKSEHFLSKPGEPGLANGIAHLLGQDGGTGIMKSNRLQNEHVQRYHAIIANGFGKIAGPLLVVHGVTDVQWSSAATTAALKRTAEGFPESQLEYVLIPDVGHVSTLQASQRLWMEWITDQFARREVTHNVQRTVLPRARLAASYKEEQNWYLAPATQCFHTA